MEGRPPPPPRLISSTSYYLYLCLTEVNKFAFFVFAVQQISCPSSASIDGLVDQKQEWSLKGSAQGMSPSAGTGLKSNSVNSPESPVRQDEQYVFESVKVSLFRFILSLLLLTLSGYAGCRWYARSSQRLPTTVSTNMIVLIAKLHFEKLSFWRDLSTL